MSTPFPPPHEGHMYVLRKATGKVALIANSMFKPEVHTEWDYRKPQPDPAAEANKLISEATTENAEWEAKKKQELEAKVKAEEAQKAKEEMARLSFGKLRQLPEFDTLKEKNFRNKEDLIEAILTIKGLR